VFIRQNAGKKSKGAEVFLFDFITASTWVMMRKLGIPRKPPATGLRCSLLKRRSGEERKKGGIIKEYSQASTIPRGDAEIKSTRRNEIGTRAHRTAHGGELGGRNIQSLILAFRPIQWDFATLAQRGYLLVRPHRRLDKPCCRSIKKGRRGRREGGNRTGCHVWWYVLSGMLLFYQKDRPEKGPKVSVDAITNKTGYVSRKDLSAVGSAACCYIAGRLFEEGRGKGGLRPGTRAVTRDQNQQQHEEGGRREKGGGQFTFVLLARREKRGLKTLTSRITSSKNEPNVGMSENGSKEEG